MAISFRKSFKVGPFRTTVSNRGITNSVGANGVRVGLPGVKRGKKTEKQPAGPIKSFFSTVFAILFWGVVALIAYALLS